MLDCEPFVVPACVLVFTLFFFALVRKGLTCGHEPTRKLCTRIWVDFLEGDLAPRFRPLGRERGDVCFICGQRRETPHDHERHER